MKSHHSYMSNYIELQYWGMAKFSWTYIESPTLYSMHITLFMWIMNNFFSNCKNKNESALQKTDEWWILKKCNGRWFLPVYLINQNNLDRCFSIGVFLPWYSPREKKRWLLIFFSFYNYNKVKFHIDIDVIELEIQFTFSLVQSLLYG